MKKTKRTVLLNETSLILMKCMTTVILCSNICSNVNSDYIWGVIFIIILAKFTIVFLF